MCQQWRRVVGARQVRRGSDVPQLEVRMHAGAGRLGGRPGSQRRFGDYGRSRPKVPSAHGGTISTAFAREPGGGKRQRIGARANRLLQQMCGEWRQAGRRRGSEMTGWTRLIKKPPRTKSASGRKRPLRHIRSDWSFATASDRHTSFQAIGLLSNPTARWRSRLRRNRRQDRRRGAA